MVQSIKKKFRSVLVAGIFALASTAQSLAAFATFDNFSSTNADSLDPTVTVSEIVGGFLVNIMLAAGQFGSLTGFFFDLDGRSLQLGLNTVQSDIMNFTPSVSIINFDNDTIDLGGGVNLNGGFTPAVDDSNFEAAFSIAQTPVPISFEIKDQSGAVLLDDFSRIGLRLQTTSNTGGSDKLIAVSSTRRIAPIPAAIPLFSTGLAMLGILGWRRKRVESA